MSIDQFLTPFSDDAPCGVSMEYDNSFKTLEAAGLGKPEVQVGDSIIAAVAPDFKTVIELSEQLFEKTKDLRVAIFWARAQTAANGLAGFNSGLDLITGLASQFWETCHPLIEDPSSEIDITTRVNTLAPLADLNDFFALLRNTVFVEQRGVGSASIRDVEIALDLLRQTEDSATPRVSIEAIRQILTNLISEEPNRPLLASLAVEKINALNQFLENTVQNAEIPDFSEILARLTPMAKLEKECSSSGEAVDSEQIDGDEGLPSAGASLSGGIRSRADARRAMTLACEYLERSEPSNPASIFLRRAISLLDKSFLDIVQDLSPDSLEAFQKYAPREPNTEN